ncbi:protein-tyrosine phosphatase [Desulfocicer vacuolatum DSM 3385]|uniref:protein-tyrosine-phosphatase n=1 Tax=Desulfocicer vacuolatum DSM 3385 TaxID=1121400 RepID=A0A1W1ZPP2_9BACT|nr:hypothetical protein [Desulfocicer vacuolatum]SMC50327.1 protein-tyrosine phosphatase [Desulfocicer vacuolatum DSM 3385]
MIRTLLKPLRRYLPNRWKKKAVRFKDNLIQSVRYYLLDINLFKKKRVDVKNIIFLCKGNICRSVFAEHRARQLAGEQKLIFKSYGLDVDQGSQSPREAVIAAERFGCDLRDHRALRITQEALDAADIVFSMAYPQHLRLKKQCKNKEKVVLLRPFAPFPRSLFCNIDDPYGGTEREFYQVFKCIDHALTALLKEIGRQ